MDTSTPKTGTVKPNTAKKAKGESIVSRLFGFGKKKDPVVEEPTLEGIVESTHEAIGAGAARQ